MPCDRISATSSATANGGRASTTVGVRRQFVGVWRIDRANQIMVLRRRAESGELEPAGGEEHAKLATLDPITDRADRAAGGHDVGSRRKRRRSVSPDVVVDAVVDIRHADPLVAPRGSTRGV